MKRAVVAAAALAVVALAWLLLRPPPTETPPPRSLPDRPPPTAAAPRPRPVPTAAPIAAADPLPDTVGVEALEAVGAAAGEGVVRCLLDEVPTVGFTPLGAVSHGQLVGDRYVFTTPLASGTVRLDPSSPDFGRNSEDEFFEAIRPLAVFSWTGAGPGRSAECTSRVPTEITLSGTVEGVPPTESDRGARIVGCEGQPVPVRPDGSFVQHTWTGPPCAFQIGGNDGVLVERESDQDGLRFSWPIAAPADAPSFWERRVARAQRPSEDEEAMAAALGGPLSPDARAVIERWLAEAREARERELEFARRQLDRAPP